MAQPDPDEEPRVEPFGNILATLQKGTTHNELGRELHALVANVLDIGKPGTLTLVLKVVPSKEYGRVEIQDKVTAKHPERDRYASIYYVAPDGNLSRSDPNQLSFDVGPHAVPEAK